MNEYGETVQQLGKNDRKALISTCLENIEKFGETVERYLGLVEGRMEEGEEGDVEKEGGEGEKEREKATEKDLEKMVESLREGYVFPLLDL